MCHVQVLTANGSIHIIFFIIVIFMGSFYLVNLILAIVAMSYDDCQKQEQEEEKAEAMVKAFRSPGYASAGRPVNDVVSLLLFCFWHFAVPYLGAVSADCRRTFKDDWKLVSAPKELKVHVIVFGTKSSSFFDRSPCNFAK